MGERTIIVVRHGSTEWSTTGRFAGHCDVPLSPQGRAEARTTAAELARLRPSAVVSSDLVRAAGTAAEVAAAAGIGFTLDARLREEDLGAWAGLDKAAVRQRFPAEFAQWRAGGIWAASSNREGLDAVADRAATAIHEIKTDGDGPIVVVTHANTAYALAFRLLGDAGPWADLPPAGYLRLTESEGRQWHLLP